MSTVLEALTAQYTSALQDYCAGGGEGTLQRAYDIGRQAIADGIGVLVIATVHHQALRTALLGTTTPEEIVQVIQQALDFFTECLGSFEMALRGFREANVTLRYLNETPLKERVRQQVEALERVGRLRALGQMASGIAHDINNAISPITLYVESLLASEPTLSARARAYLSTVQQAAHDVAHTVARLREFSRQSGDAHEARPVDLNQIVPQVVDLTRAKWRDEPQRLGMTITMHTARQEDGLPPIVGVESELREALINLIFNAVDAMPEGGSLTLQTWATPTTVVVEVIDTGMGMDEATRQRCLEPFYTTKNDRGTGLGLAMVYGITERHAAQLIIESAVGQGTTVRLLFPVAPRQGERHNQPAESEASTRPLRILVVDDDPLVRQLLRDVLQVEGHVVTVVDGGRGGLEALRVARERQEPFEVVLTDLGMPEMDGREVARGVKHVAPDTPVILLTGWGQALQQEGTLPPHVDLLLSKPPGLRELRAALRAVARPAGRKGQTA